MSAEFPTIRPTTSSSDARSDESRSRGSATSPSARIGQEALAKMPAAEQGKWARLKGRISRYYENSDNYPPLSDPSACYLGENSKKLAIPFTKD